MARIGIVRYELYSRLGPPGDVVATALFAVRLAGAMILCGLLGKGLAAPRA